MKVLIIEDEPQTAKLLKEIIELQPRAEVVKIIESIDESVRYLTAKANHPDLIFMDIQLTDGLSFEIFSRVAINSPVIFCTTYDQYSLQAFKANGIEYILKPVREEDIRKAFEKVERLRLAFNTDNEIISALKKTFAEKNKVKSSILIQHRESYIPLAITNIAFCLLENEIVYAFTFDHQKHPVFKTLEEMESALDPDLFFRINRQTLLNRASIKEITPWFNRKVIVKTNPEASEKLIVSRLKVSEFMNWIEKP